MDDVDIEDRLKQLDRAEMAIDNSFATGKAERSKITRMAQLDAAEAVAMVGVAMEADEAADEAMRITVIAEQSGDREKARAARKREREARKQANADLQTSSAPHRSRHSTTPWPIPYRSNSFPLRMFAKTSRSPRRSPKKTRHICSSS